MQERTARVYRVKAVAEMFDVSVATIYRAIEGGQLHALKLGTGRGTIRVPQSALEAFANACGRTTDDQHGQGRATDFTAGHDDRASESAGGGQP